MLAKNPTIVLALFNRAEPATRVLCSLNESIYPETPVNLVISIDNDNNKNLEILKIAEDFHWKFGSKQVIFHPKNLGLREHFNFCGNLTEKLEAVIFLEDDLFVSKYFYDFSLQALNFFKDDEKVAGISLFNYNRIEQWENPRPFTPIDDGNDNYFLQQASWGQIWTHEMWKPFQDWFKINGKAEKINSFDLPLTVKGWPATSWKKYFIAYMIVNRKYYVFPRISLTTNFDDVGINRKSETVYYQSPVLVSGKTFRFNKFKESMSVYDSYFEILPEILKKFNPALNKYDFEVNLYGNKEIENLKKDLVLSKKKGNHNILSFNLVMKPHELNVIFNQAGHGIYLNQKKDLINGIKSGEFVSDLVYYYRNTFSLKEIRFLLTFKFKNKVQNILKRFHFN